MASVTTDRTHYAPGETVVATVGADVTTQPVTRTVNVAATVELSTTTETAETQFTYDAEAAVTVNAVTVESDDPAVRFVQDAADPFRFTATIPGGTTDPDPDPDYACVQTDPKGRCSYGPVPYITGANSAPWVDQNVWTGDPGYRQTLHSASPRDWYIIGNADTNNGGVLTFANTGFWMDGVARTIPTTSSWAVDFPHEPENGVIAWAMYDLWFNDWADEVSILVDLSVNQYYDCSHVDTGTISGRDWHLCVFGAQRVLKPGPDDRNLRLEPSGSIDIAEVVAWLEDNGHLPQNSTWTASSFGYEVCDTGGRDVKFAVKDFTWHA